MDMLYYWFALGAIPGCITWGEITLLKKGGRHVWGEIKRVQLHNSAKHRVKDFVSVVAKRLQIVISNLIGLEPTYSVKGKSIQNNLPLVHEVLEGLDDDSEARLISLGQFMDFDRVLATVLKIAGFEPEFNKWISMNYHNT